MSEAAILTCALAGGVVTGNPNQPETRADVIREGIGAARAGASVLHVHARREEGGFSQAPEDYEAIRRAIREEVGDVIFNFTTGGVLGSGPRERRRSLEADPEVASLNCGSVNFGPGDTVFLNPPSLIEDIRGEMARRGVLPEYECFDMGMAATAARMAAEAEGSAGMMHLVLGVLGGAPPHPGCVTLFAELVPAGVPWMVTGLGRHNLRLMPLVLSLGGHVRTGLEDVVHFSRGELAESNAQLVERAKAVCESMGRGPASVAEAREILGLAA
jgi:3-keto-5-aminohexanoate cleavage enzyme